VNPRGNPKSCPGATCGERGPQRPFGRGEGKAVEGYEGQVWLYAGVVSANSEDKSIMGVSPSPNVGI